MTGHRPPPSLRSKRRTTILPLVSLLKNRLSTGQVPEVFSEATSSWEISPGTETLARRAFFLPGQIERVKGWTFTHEHPGREMLGGDVARHAPTRAFLLENVWLLDGTLYRGSARTFLLARAGRMPRLEAEVEIKHAALYCSAIGNKYFGNWLMDDCVTYQLAAAEAVPITTDQAVSLHVLGYEDWLGMRPTRVGNAFFHRLTVFQDFGQNRSKHARFRAVGEALRAHVKWTPHPGVFILRGQGGLRRVFRNELEVAERLRDRRGFRIVDPTAAGVSEIVAACAGARAVVGIEGSALVHGVVGLQPGGAVLALQPPNRFVTVYKHLTDREGQNFGFVVGSSIGEDFSVDPDEVERTLDLFPPVEAGQSLAA
jgi:hypothetical protein